MVKIQILDRTKKKSFTERISNVGIKKINEILIRTGKERIRAYSGNLSKEEIYDIWKILPIEGIGLYIGKDTINQHGVKDSRLSIDALHMFKDQINSDIITLTKDQEEEWFRGKNIELENEQLEKIKNNKFVAVMSNDKKDFIGTGKISNEILYSFLPKERRRKSQLIK
jgi:NOL1/NOP2/fmu family ribosome biogenesis protein